MPKRNGGLLSRLFRRKVAVANAADENVVSKNETEVAPKNPKKKGILSRVAKAFKSRFLGRSEVYNFEDGVYDNAENVDGGALTLPTDSQYEAGNSSMPPTDSQYEARNPLTPTTDSQTGPRYENPEGNGYTANQEPLYATIDEIYAEIYKSKDPSAHDYEVPFAKPLREGVALRPNSRFNQPKFQLKAGAKANAANSKFSRPVPSDSEYEAGPAAKEEIVVKNYKAAPVAQSSTKNKKAEQTSLPNSIDDVNEQETKRPETLGEIEVALSIFGKIAKDCQANISTIEKQGNLSKEKKDSQLKPLQEYLKGIKDEIKILKEQKRGFMASAKSGEKKQEEKSNKNPNNSTKKPSAKTLQRDQKQH